MAAQRNKVAYITGSSKGIGKALAEKLLENGFEVIGLSRSNTIQHPNFKHEFLDLNDLEAVHSYAFELNAKEVLLVNNAGIIGEISPVGNLSGKSIEAVLNVNTIAPQVLMNSFLKTYTETVDSGHILNISSGAGKNPIDAWASYCASKAALDLFSQTIKTEWELRNIDNWHIHSIAPGVVDTNMQADIRSAEPGAFKLIDKFIGLKNDGDLSDPKQVANQLFQVINSPKEFHDPIISVRDF